MSTSHGISKSPTGIAGFDDLTLGGVPTGRPTLVCGSAGCGKSLFATTFLVHGARDYAEPGVFVTFEERPGDIVANVSSLGFALDKLVDDQKIAFEYVALDRSELEEAGDYDLEGLFLRLESAIDSIGAKRVVLDTIESLFSAFSNEAILRAEIRRLFDWLKDKGMTTVITAERGDGTLTRQGLEEYVSDCVILLDHRVQNQISTRRLRIVKYRGTAHGTNEYPFLIDQDGFSVLPVSTLGLEHKIFEDRISSGIADLDNMLAGGGFHRGSSILISGVAGSGKSTVAASFAEAACAAGERALVFSFEESADQSVRNMKVVVNQFYRERKLPIAPNGTNTPIPELRPLAQTLNETTHMTDAKAFLAWLDSQPSVAKDRKIGTQGYCMGGPMAFRTAAAMPERVGAVASFHGGGLVAEQPNSPHLQASKSKAQFLIAIASNDDQRSPNEKNVLKEAFESAKLPAEIEVYSGAHGWCPPDSRVYNEPDAEKAWARLLALYGKALA